MAEVNAALQKNVGLPFVAGELQCAATQGYAPCFHRTSHADMQRALW